MFNFFKKKESKKAPKKQATKAVDLDNLDFDVVTWHKFNEPIGALLDEMTKADAFDKQYGSTVLPCFIVHERDNESDPNAMLIRAKCPKVGKKWHDIGYVPAELTKVVKEANKKVKDGNYFWFLRMWSDNVSGTRFNVQLKKSKFAK